MIRLVPAAEAAADASVLVLANDADPREASLAGVERVELHFPKFTDGRAYSQAVMLRRRLGFRGDIRATGDVLVDQLVHMERTGFTSAVLSVHHAAADVERQFARFPAFYQGDALAATPRFARS